MCLGTFVFKRYLRQHKSLFLTLRVIWDVYQSKINEKKIYFRTKLNSSLFYTRRFNCFPSQIISLLSINCPTSLFKYIVTMIRLFCCIVNKWILHIHCLIFWNSKSQIYVGRKAFTIDMESSQWSVDTIETNPLFDDILDAIYKSLYIIIFTNELKYNTSIT